MFTGAKAAILPGLVATKLAGEVVTLADVYADTERPFGLFANFVGGELSDIPSDFDRVGVWRGAGGVFEILAPAFDDTDLATDAAAEDGLGATEVYLTNNAAGALVSAGPNSHVENEPARLLSRLSANAIIVELLV
jgi:hypothetical protein